MAKEKIIEIKNLYFSYDNENLVINDLSLDIYENEWVCILGHNGSGKSTLSKLIIGLLEPLKGSIIVDNKELTEDTVYDIRRVVSIVFQNPDNQFVGTTVIDDIAFGLENQQIPRDEMLRRIDDVIKRVRMEKYLHQEPHLLSGGQKQRVAIAGALALNSKVIIFDESTSMLDPEGREDVVSIIRQLSGEGNKTIISITHDLNEALLADRLVLMREGQVVKTGKPDELMKDEALMKECRLDVPLTVKVSQALNQQHLLNDLYVKQEDLVNALWEFNSKE